LTIRKRNAAVKNGVSGYFAIQVVEVVVIRGSLYVAKQQMRSGGGPFLLPIPGMDHYAL